ncbi:hypothetical protein GTA08_BOTSDO08348 [Neofusicoccum parvum]|uniref:Uncharacterized protein n=1 Tax=Neofusicoccum parvum TaxID=310453 RepID=A0ACB5SDF3_9PEZI|nr:hypothetical protein GTA08_BOTSDO08348 [Neofusicoccum parvum]
MATSTKIHLTINEKPAFFISPLRKDSAEKTSELLQENHEKHHTYIDDLGRHNHIVHHLLTLYAIGASPSEIQKAYDVNKTYQLPAVTLDPTIVQGLGDTAVFAKHLGNGSHYRNYLAHFSAEIDGKGVAAVLSEYLFARDDRANDLLSRLFAGFAHPLIHLGCGLEFGQPAIVAEALAGAAVHEAWIGEFLLGAERVAAAREEAEEADGVTLLELFEEVGVNEKLARATTWEDENDGLRDGVIGRAGKEMCEIAGKWVVKSENELYRKTAEMIDASVFYTTTAQRPPHIQKLDFFYMHSITTSVYFTDFLTNTDLLPSDRARLLEWKARWDLANYASRGTAPLLTSELTDYTPKNPGDSWDELLNRARAFVDEDDGHAAKMIRALASGSEVCKSVDRTRFGLKTQDLWLKAANMGMDSVEAGEPNWVRGAGFKQAWADVPLRKM